MNIRLNVIGQSPFAALSNHPQFQQLRQLIRQQPQLLEPLLQQIGQSQPQLLQVSIFISHTERSLYNQLYFIISTFTPFIDSFKYS